MTSRIRARLTAGLTSVALLAAGCGSTAAAPSASDDGTRVSSCGLELTFERPPERVVTLDQSSTETLLALGLADRMAGTSNLKTKVAAQYREAYAEVPVLAPKLLTGEQLRAASPDLVVSSFTDLYTRDRVGTRAELHELGLPSYVSAVDCPEHGGGKTPFERLFADYQRLGRVFGVEERAAELVAAQRKVLREARATRADEPSVLWLYSVFDGVPYVAGGTGIPAAMSDVLGVRNVFADVDEDWPEVSWEQIAQRKPDVIVVGDLSERGTPGDSAAEKIALLREHPVVGKLPAVTEDRIVEVPGIELDPSVRSVDALAVVAAGLADLGYAR